MVESEFEFEVPESRRCHVCSEPEWICEDDPEIERVQKEYGDTRLQKIVLHKLGEVIHYPTSLTLHVTFFERESKFQGRDNDGRELFYLSKEKGYLAVHPLAIVDGRVVDSPVSLPALVYHDRNVDLYTDDVQDDEIECENVRIQQGGPEAASSHLRFVNHPDSVYKQIRLSD